jgi:hypothetical protein
LAGPISPRASDQRQVRRVGDQELALGVGEVPHELVAAVRWIATDDDGAGQRRRLEPEDELGHVVEQERHVKRPVLA